MKLAFQQPLVPVLPVAKELLSKTKWMAGSGKVKTTKLIKKQAKLTSSTEYSVNGSEYNRSVSGPSAITPTSSAKTQRFAISNWVDEFALTQLQSLKG